MSSQHQIVLFYDGELFSPYYFYSKFLSEVASYYRNVNANETVAFQFTDGKNIVMGNYRVDPIALPLLLSLSQQLRLNQAEPIRLELSNVPSTNALIEFLFRSDFFYLSGDNTNPSFPQGKNIFFFDEKQIGDFHHRDIRPEHKIRCYSLLEAGDLVNIAHLIEDEEDRRDRFVEYYSFEVTEHFQTLLQEFSSDNVYFYVDVLSELITNGVMHSGTDVFALMFSDRFATKFSISDNGVGFEASLSKKEDTLYYKKFELTKQISNDFKLQNNASIQSLLSIIEALYFSMTKSRVGLFDLVLSVVCEHSGYFRLHNDYAQVVISARMLDELIVLQQLRKKIRKTYSLKNYNRITDGEFNKDICSVILQSKKAMMNLFRKIWTNCNEDVRFSAVRFFPIRFRGVHIEAEISK